jgi:hypothetical protein
MTFVPGPYQRQSALPIQLSALLVVEGRDAFEFVLALLTELGLNNQIEVRDGGGVAKRATGDFEKYLRLLPTISGFDKVTSLGIMRDAETDPTQAFQDVCKALQHAALPVPNAALQATQKTTPTVTVMILPDAATPGMLETLCWRALGGDPRLPCVDEFLKCIEKETGQPVARPDKSRVYAYIAVREEPQFLLGLAARAKYFPWTATAFDEIRTFVQNIIKAVP